MCGCASLEMGGSVCSLSISGARGLSRLFEHSTQAGMAGDGGHGARLSIFKASAKMVSLSLSLSQQLHLYWMDLLRF